MIRYLILLFVIGLVGCSQEKKELTLSPSEEKGYTDLFQFFLARFASARSDFELIKTDRESKGLRGGELIPEEYNLEMINLYNLLVDLNKKLSENINNEIKDEISTLRNHLKGVRKLKLPFTFYVKLIDLENRLSAIDFNRIKYRSQLNEIIKLNLLVADLTLRRKVDCSIELWDYYSTGMMLKAFPYEDSVCFYHSSLTLMPLDLKLNYYNKRGDLLLTKDFMQIDSIQLKKSSDFALCEIIYTNSNNFHDYVKLGEISDAAILKIREKNYQKLDLDNWMEDQIEECLQGTKGFRSLNLDELYEKRSVIRYKAKGNYTFEDLKEVVNIIYQARNKHKHFSNELFDLEGVIDNENIPFRDFILEYENDLWSFNDYSYFILLTSAMYHFWVYDTYCKRWWGPSSTDYFGVYKKSDNEIIYFTSALLVFHRIRGTENYHESIWKEKFDSIPFPLPGYFRRVDGSMKKVDSLYKENLLHFSTNY